MHLPRRVDQQQMQRGRAVMTDHPGQGLPVAGGRRPQIEADPLRRIIPGPADEIQRRTLRLRDRPGGRVGPV
jgi:hypothetical protein